MRDLAARAPRAHRGHVLALARALVLRDRLVLALAVHPVRVVRVERLRQEKHRVRSVPRQRVVAVVSSIRRPRKAR